MFDECSAGRYNIINVSATDRRLVHILMITKVTAKFSQDRRLFLCLATLTMRVTKTIESHAERNHCNKVTDGNHNMRPPV